MVQRQEGHEKRLGKVHLKAKEGAHCGRWEIKTRLKQKHRSNSSESKCIHENKRPIYK